MTACSKLEEMAPCNLNHLQGLIGRAEHGTHMHFEFVRFSVLDPNVRNMKDEINRGRCRDDDLRHFFFHRCQRHDVLRFYFRYLNKLIVAILQQLPAEEPALKAAIQEFSDGIQTGLGVGEADRNACGMDERGQALLSQPATSFRSSQPYGAHKCGDGSDSAHPFSPFVVGVRDCNEHMDRSSCAKRADDRNQNEPDDAVEVFSHIAHLKNRRDRSTAATLTRSACRCIGCLQPQGQPHLAGCPYARFTIH